VDGLVAGRDVTLQASMLKLKAGRLSRQVTDRYVVLFRQVTDR
jgi:hypothetical protein